MTEKKSNLINFGKIGEMHLKLAIPSLEACYPGMEPSEYNLIIAPAVTRNTVGKSSLILIADDTKAQLDMAVQVGRIVAVSPLAFNFANWGDNLPPQIGDVVWFAKFAGGVFEGVDGREYRLIKDKDITGVLPPVDQEKLEEAKQFSETV